MLRVGLRITPGYPPDTKLELLGIDAEHDPGSWSDGPARHGLEIAVDARLYTTIHDDRQIRSGFLDVLVGRVSHMSSGSQMTSG